MDRSYLNVNIPSQTTNVMSLKIFAAVTMAKLIHFANINTANAQHDNRGTHPQDLSFNTSNCRCFPGDPCWPSISDWIALNRSLHGNLVATVTLASPCHDKFFDANKCAWLQSTWFFPETHLISSSSIMAPFFASNSCNPFLRRNSRCDLENYVSYAVNVSNIADIQTTVKFVKKRNIRLTIRNTGHDYNGKATGAGAVAFLDTLHEINGNCELYRFNVRRKSPENGSWRASSRGISVYS